MARQKKQRTTADLREILFDEIDAVRSEDGDPVRARTVATLSKEILSTARLEMQHRESVARLQREGANVSFQPLALGSK